MQSGSSLGLAVDIGGTFTDVVLSDGVTISTTKVLTTPHAPELGLLTGIADILQRNGCRFQDVGRIVHGTTLATNALIERKGARTALICTDGFRDILEIGTEGRYDQYQLALERPKPLVPRPLRLSVRERIDALGAPRLHLNLSDVDAIVPKLLAADVESVAVALMHAYANPAHEQAVAERLTAAIPGLSVSLSSAVCPEIREYDRTSTTVANAYVQPLMVRYLQRMRDNLREQGFTGSISLMASSGGLTSLETAMAYPVRLVESGPAGGTIYALGVAQAMGAERALAFDMGGTTAKVTLLDDFAWQNARTFEVDRVARFMKGSGLPIRIPCIDMVEIGAGGGSLARVDALDKVLVGPESASSDPGPACYQRGGMHPAVTDADLILGLIDPAGFAGGTIELDPALASEALTRDVGRVLGIGGPEAAYAIYETVCETMANAARVHCVERGVDPGGRTVIAFGGAAPLHVARVAEKIGAQRVVVPGNASVGSAVGFLDAPVSFETVRTRYMRLDAFNAEAAGSVLDDMAREARRFVVSAADDAALTERRTAHMRYVGQGQDIVVDLPLRALGPGDAVRLRELFEAEYVRLYTRAVPAAQIEIMAWSVSISTASPARARIGAVPVSETVPDGFGRFFDGRRGAYVDIARYRRENLAAGARLAGPAIIVERETSTFVSDAFDASIDGAGSIVMVRKEYAA